MAHTKLRLTGCDRYNFKGELYEKGKVYLVGEAKAKILMRKQDEYDRPYFTTYIAPTKSKAERIAEAASVALAQAAADIEAEENAIVDNTAEVVEEEVVVDPEAAIVAEVDTDDDPDLDEDDEPNPEEVDEDRDDGTAVEV